MKKTYITIIAAAATLFAASCSKTEIPVAPAQEGTPMTLKATIGGEDTKISYTPDGNVLKTAWEASETITVITLDGSNKVVTIDNFTYSGAAGQKTVEFTGSLSTGATEKIKVLYPALTETFTSSGYTYYGSPKYDGQTDLYHLMRARIGSSTMTIEAKGATQSASGNTEHLKNCLAYEGTGTISGGTLAVEMKALSSVLRLDITLPSSAVGSNTIKWVQLIAYTDKSSDTDYYFNPDSQWFYYFDGGDIPKASRESNINMGSWSGTTQTNMAITDTKLTVYLPFVPGKDATFGPAGGKDIQVTIYGSGSNYDVTKTLTTDTKLEPGKVYRMSVDASSL